MLFNKLFEEIYVNNVITSPTTFTSNKRLESIKDGEYNLITYIESTQQVFVCYRCKNNM